MIFNQIIINCLLEDKEKIRIAEEKIREELKDKTIETNQEKQSDGLKINLKIKMKIIIITKIKYEKEITNKNIEKK